MPVRRSSSRVALFAALAVIGALPLGCADWPTAQLPAGPQALISDATHGGGKPHFYFLPPLVSAPVVSGTFDPALQPEVDICALSDGGCAFGVAHFSMATGPGAETVRLDMHAELYSVNWNTGQFVLDPAVTYRIRVLVGDFELGFADVDLVSGGEELKNVNTGEFIPLLDGRTLPIKFRIEQRFVASATLTPAFANVPIGGTQQYVFAVLDLHGVPISGFAVEWTSSDHDVATVSQTGLATAAANGETTITATAAGVSASAGLVVRDVLSLAAMSAGDLHTCGVAPSGAAYCWGNNLRGRLGEGTTTDRTTPVLVVGGLTFTSVSAGPLHTCGVTPIGAAYCWGDNLFGQLGDGTTTTLRTSPVPVQGGLTFTVVSAGPLHTCGVTTSGAAYCWGSNFDGQLGTSAVGPNVCAFGFGCTTVPVAVTGGLTFATVSAGGSGGSEASHTCGITTGGAAYCWGGNVGGQLGDGTTIERTSPVRVAGGLTFAAVSAGSFLHTCGVTTTGAAYCWGDNEAGQLGNGAIGQTLCGFGFPCSTVPVAVGGGLSFAAVSAGRAHSCGVTRSSAAYCWGSNGFGQLGDATTTTPRTSPVPVVGGLAFAAVTAGGAHTCGVTTSRGAYCWGFDGFGQLGDGTTAFVRTSPVRVVQ